jgi:hypothetical protein
MPAGAELDDQLIQLMGDYVEKNPGVTLEEAQQEFYNVFLDAGRQSPPKAVAANLRSNISRGRVYKEGEGKQAKYFPVHPSERKDTPVPSAKSTQEISIVSRPDSPVRFSLAAVRPISQFNARPRVAKFNYASLEVLHCEGFIESANGMDVPVSLGGGGVTFHVVEEAPEEILVSDARALHKSVTIELIPIKGKQLIVNGQPQPSDQKCFFGVPADSWLIMIPEDSSQNFVRVVGQPYNIKACGFLFSDSIFFEDEKTISVPMLRDASLTIGRGEGYPVKQKFVGLAVLGRDLPDEFQLEFQAQLPKHRDPKDNYAGILSFQVPPEGITWEFLRA